MHNQSTLGRNKISPMSTSVYVVFIINFAHVAKPRKDYMYGFWNVHT